MLWLWRYFFFFLVGVGLCGVVWLLLICFECVLRWDGVVYCVKDVYDLWWFVIFECDMGLEWVLVRGGEREREVYCYYWDLLVVGSGCIYFYCGRLVVVFGWFWYLMVSLLVLLFVVFVFGFLFVGILCKYWWVWEWRVLVRFIWGWFGKGFMGWWWWC